LFCYLNGRSTFNPNAGQKKAARNAGRRIYLEKKALYFEINKRWELLCPLLITVKV